MMTIAYTYCQEHAAILAQALPEPSGLDSRDASCDLTTNLPALPCALGAHAVCVLCVSRACRLRLCVSKACRLRLLANLLACCDC